MITDWMRKAAGLVSRFGFLALILTNLIPVGGVLFLGWDAGVILILYWVENVIIGLLTLPRILSAQGAMPDSTGRAPPTRLGMGCFFVVHYGLFTLVHGVFTLVVAASFGPAEATAGASLGWAVLAMAALQVVAFVREWVAPRAWRTASPMTEMFRPYGRVIVLHITVMLGAWGLSELSAPTWTILVLCLLKAALDLVLTALTRAKVPAPQS